MTVAFRFPKDPGASIGHCDKRRKKCRLAWISTGARPVRDRLRFARERKLRRIREPRGFDFNGARQSIQGFGLRLLALAL